MNEQELKTKNENEAKIFTAIQDLKDSIFGLKQPFTSLCYDYDQENGYILNCKKINIFSDELCDIAENTGYYKDSFADILPCFFKLSIIYLYAACNPSDWIFASFRKLGNTIYKEQEDEQSVFDILVEDSTKYLTNNLFWEEYKTFNTLIKNVDLSDIDLCIKHAVEEYIDEHKLNSLNDNNLTNKFIFRLNSTSSIIAKTLATKNHQ